ncbi:hypothetical protein N7535_005990 [Penicillium sp. DV-2018c]|nr:hypothetical protein N7461_009569 [Penicillium sp. DV-2018c]KAJ5572330.1 hypothetical protein N7535_005990 [Penicillium sp. DV-2018c]
MYMCSNTGLSGWAELRIALVFVFTRSLKHIIKTTMLHVTSLGPGCRLPGSLFPPLTSPPSPRFIGSFVHVSQRIIL